MKTVETVERKSLGLNFDVKSVEEAGTFSGYGSVFGNRDAYDDIVEAGAFAKSIAKKAPILLWQHNSDEPIGVFTKVEEREKGLYVEAKLLIDDVVRAKEAHALLKNGAIKGLSIGYIPTAWEFRSEGKERIRVLKEVDLWEISLVTFPANRAAQVQNVKKLEEENLKKEVYFAVKRLIRKIKGW